MMMKEKKLTIAIVFSLLTTFPKYGFAFTMPSIVNQPPYTTQGKIGQNSYMTVTANHRMNNAGLLASLNQEPKTEEKDLGLQNTLANMMGNITKNAQTYFIKHHKEIIATIIIALMIFLAPKPATPIESGGRIGGSYGPSQDRRQSYSSPAPSSSSSSYSRGFTRGFGSGYYSRPPIVVNPYPSPYYSPFWGPSIFPRFGTGGGVVVSPGFSFGIFGFIGVLLFFVFPLFSIGFPTFKDKNNSLSSTKDKLMEAGALGKGLCVSRISVALQIPDRNNPDSVLKKLRRLATSGRGGSRKDIQFLTNEVAIELLRQKRSIVACSTQSMHLSQRNKAEREFNRIATKERGKFEREAVSTYGGVVQSESSTPVKDPLQSKATLAVVTIILSIEGDSTKLPRIASMEDVTTALGRIAADVKVDDCLESVEILWTPEDGEESLTKRDIIADYPDLNFI